MQLMLGLLSVGMTMEVAIVFKASCLGRLGDKAAGQRLTNMPALGA
jgi:hypothetical protein